MIARLRLAALLLSVVASLGVAPAGLAQIPGLGKASGDATAAAPEDPLGRSTPRGAIVGFARAMEREDFTNAALYLQLRGDQKADAESLAKSLNLLIDRGLREAIGHISDLPEGNVEDGLPVDREQLGPLKIDGSQFYIGLVRIKNKDGISIWLVSTETLAQVPAIAVSIDQTWMERHFPQSMLTHEFLGLSLAHWMVLVGLLAGAFGLLWLISAVTAWITHRLVRDPAKRLNWDAWFDATRWPAIAVLTLLIQFTAVPQLGYPLAFRAIYSHIGLVALVIVFTWLLKRGLTLVFAHARMLVRGKNHASTQSLMLLAERMIKALLLVVAGVAILILLGVESKTALAALGVVGVALALGAQKTVENLLGGIFLLTDKALAVGDSCTIGGQSGTVEDVTLRSVRLRTAQQSLVSLPAGSLAQAGIENFASRRKMLLLTTLRLRYGTSAQQLRDILSGIRALLARNSRIDQADCYVRLVNFGAAAIELELSAYVLTIDVEAFRECREELLLGIASTVESAGSALAPTSFIQVDERLR